MPTSAADPTANGLTRLVFVDEAGRLDRWLLLDGRKVIHRGDTEAGLQGSARTVLAVPGDQVALHWLDLDEGLAPAQAAAAARLMLADASADPLSAMHVAVGRAEAGRTPAALVPNARMSEWMAAAAAAGLDPEAIVPAPLLLAPPAAGFLRRDRGDSADYRGRGAAFSLEPELAEAVVAGAPVEAVDEAGFEAGLAPLAAAPALNLRQGAFARRRSWQVARGRARRIVLLAVALALLSLVVQVATILSYTFAADRAQAEADALASRSGPARGAGPGFAALASVLFEAVRATPNAELTSARLPSGRKPRRHRHHRQPGDAGGAPGPDRGERPRTRRPASAATPADARRPKSGSAADEQLGAASGGGNGRCASSGCCSSCSLWSLWLRAGCW